MISEVSYNECVEKAAKIEHTEGRLFGRRVTSEQYQMARDCFGAAAVVLVALSILAPHGTGAVVTGIIGGVSGALAVGAACKVHALRKVSEYKGKADDPSRSSPLFNQKWNESITKRFNDLEKEYQSSIK